MREPPTKATIRAEALARRDAMTAAERAIASVFMARNVQPVLAAARPRSVGAYRAFGSEADPGAIVAACEADGIDVALATMVDHQVMRFYRYRTGDPLSADAMGILAPLRSSATVDPELLIVPVSAYDATGARLGKGRGIYDRALLEFRRRGRAPLLVGIAFSVQEMPSIPTEPHDVRLDWIVTETGAHDFRVIAGTKRDGIS